MRIVTSRPLITIGLLVSWDASAQSNSKTHFELASIKPGGDFFSANPQMSPGRMRWTTQVANLVGYAYRVDTTRVSGPGVGNIYTIEAIFDPEASDGQVRGMVQGLLSERFQMRSHLVTKQVDGYAIVIAKGGIKVKEAIVEQGKDLPSADTESRVTATLPTRGVTSIESHRGSISQLAETLQFVSRVPFWDQAGLTGNYNFSFRYSEEVVADRQIDAPSLATALRESLGLALNKQKGPLDDVVIDSIQPPSEN